MKNANRPTRCLTITFTQPIASVVRSLPALDRLSPLNLSLLFLSLVFSSVIFSSLHLEASLPFAMVSSSFRLLVVAVIDDINTKLEKLAICFHKTLCVCVCYVQVQFIFRNRFLIHHSTR